MPKNKKAKAVFAKKASNGIKLKDILNAEFNNKVKIKIHYKSSVLSLWSLKLALINITQSRDIFKRLKHKNQRWV
jgi:hypothetical protein